VPAPGRRYRHHRRPGEVEILPSRRDGERRRAPRLRALATLARKPRRARDAAPRPVVRSPRLRPDREGVDVLPSLDHRPALPRGGGPPDAVPVARLERPHQARRSHGTRGAQLERIVDGLSRLGEHDVRIGVGAVALAQPVRRAHPVVTFDLVAIFGRIEQPRVGSCSCHLVRTDPPHLRLPLPSAADLRGPEGDHASATAFTPKNGARGYRYRTMTVIDFTFLEAWRALRGPPPDG